MQVKHGLRLVSWCMGGIMLSVKADPSKGFMILKICVLIKDEAGLQGES
jgi:hypothetical protein